ncbi:hypothetical protein [Pollutibacter soli]|uniref:hypothetical protein n=1 Tax=Pollutibacter soli TaxID=3034157 RepID=UPI0030137C8B
MKAIGGYFEWEEPQQGKEWHSKALRLNSGRNALEYLLRTGKFKSIFLPDYCCDVLSKKAEHLNVRIIKYEVNERMEIAGTIQTPGDKSLFLAVNYFGLKNEYIAGLKAKFQHLVVDNVQAFFAEHINGTSSFNSARKFFGVPDGAYLYPFNDPDLYLEEDDSSARIQHLFDRLEKSPEAGYEKYLANEQLMGNIPLRKMSAITSGILQSLDYNRIIKKRRENYQFLHENIGQQNEFSASLPVNAVPMAYPFLSIRKGIREKMIKDRIFIPVLWPELRTNAAEKSQAYRFAEYLLPLPIDHRLNISDMDRIIKLIA